MLRRLLDWIFNKGEPHIVEDDETYDFEEGDYTEVEAYGDDDTSIVVIDTWEEVQNIGASTLERLDNTIARNEAIYERSKRLVESSHNFRR